VSSQHQVTASAGKRRGDVEVRNYLHDTAGSRSLVVSFDLSITHDRLGASTHVQQNGSLTTPQDLDAPLRIAAQRKLNSYWQQSEHFFSPRNYDHILPHALRVFASSFSTGPLLDETSMASQLAWQCVVTLRCMVLDLD
jgi:hypothetical protein